MKNLYEVLGLTEEATTSDIKRAYMKLALTAHPDKGGSEELMKLLNEAYSTLSGSSSRRKYEADYFAFKAADVDAEENIPIAGLLPKGKTLPYSQRLKKEHQKLVTKFKQEPLVVNTSTNLLSFKSDMYQYEDTLCMDTVFELIRKKGMYSNTKWLPFTKSKLTVSIAIDLFTNFLSGNYYGWKLMEISDYLVSEISTLQQDKYEHPIIQFYEGILEIFTMTHKDDSEHDKLLFSINKITEYAKNASEIQLTTIIPLFYNKFFRNLHAYSLHVFWNSEKDLFAPEHLDKFDGTQGAKELLEIYKNKLIYDNQDDNTLQFIRYIKLFYNFEQDRNSSNKSEKTAEDCRRNAFHFLDWIPTFLENSTREIIANVFLQIGIKFQQASRLETHPVVIMADEQLALKMYLTAVAYVKNKTPDIEIYIKSNIIKHLSHFQFQEPILLEAYNVFKKNMTSLVDIFPFFENYQSNIALFNPENKTLHLMRRLLNTMVDIHEYNKSHTKSINIEQSTISILYQAYEACLKNWYEDKYNPETEKKFRLELMDELLFDNGWLFFDVEQNLTSPFIMIDRDENGWFKPSRSLPFDDNTKVVKYKSINGVEINNKTGEINFFLTPWNQNMPESDKVFTQFDLQEMLEKNIGGAQFSLDPVDPDKPYHPFNLMRFAPKELNESELLNTMLLTDYILKFLTTTQEVQGEYPFEQKSVMAMIEHMPEYLRKIITDFHKASHSGAIHRFWIEAEEITIPTSDLNKSDKISIGVNDLKMVVKKHRMERDIHGELKDVGNEDEGWPIYVLNAEQVQQLKEGIRTIKGPAMIFTYGEAKLLYWEHHSEIHAHIPKNFRETLIRLYLQPRDQNGKITFNTKNMPLIYKVTKEMASQSGLETRYSAEFIFAHEFTAHYDEFAQYLPEFGRLKELSKMAVLISFLKNLRKNNEKALTALDFLMNQPLSSPPTTNVYQLFKENQEKICQGTIAQFDKWRETLSTSVVEKQCYTQVKTIKNEIGSLSFDTKSSEVKSACNRWYAEIKEQNPSATSEQIWNIIKPQKADIAYKLTNSARANCKKSLQELYSQHALPSLDALIDSFIQGDIKPLVAALLTREMKQIEAELVKVFPRDLPSDIMSALDGSHDAVLRIAYPQVRSYFEKEKKSCDIIESGYSYIKLGKQKEEVDLEGKCFWVPASVCHQAPVGTSRHSFFVYGGVNINPRVNIVQNGNIALRGNQIGGGSFSNVNAQAAMHQKLRELQKAQNHAVNTQQFDDGRIRYYTAERPSRTSGPTRGNAHVTEYNSKTGQVRSWAESYDHKGNVNRVHPKTIDGQNLISQHYPPTGSEIRQQRGY